MSKITRKSYKRNKLVLGASLFAGVALVSTGFAAWVITTNADKEVKGNVTVGTVTNQSIIIDVENHTLGNFVFEPSAAEYKDFSIKPAGSEAPNLSLVIYGKITAGTESNFKGLNFKMSEEKTGLSAAASKDYLVLPNCFQTAGVELDYTASGTYYADYAAIKAASDVSDGLYLTEAGANTYIFKYTVEFKWGTAFKGENPATYFVESYKYLCNKAGDTGASTTLITDDADLPKVSENTVTNINELVEAANTTLSDLHSTIYTGVDAEASPAYTVTIKSVTETA